MKPKVFYLFAMLCFAQTMMAQITASDTIQEKSRFFPANSIRCTNAIIAKYYNDTVYYSLHTGNDTIIDGKNCVLLWCSLTPDEPFLIHEDGGKVYINYNFYNYEDEWEMLYDFSLHEWHVGDKIYDALNGNRSLPIDSVSTITLKNGEQRQVAHYDNNATLIYGLGFIDEPFFEIYNRLAPDDGSYAYPIDFYYNDELLWGNNKNEDIPTTSKTYLVTEGKQWAVCTYSFRGDHWTNTYRLQGDTTINGKTYKIEHESQEADLSDMRPSGRYMREENGKVYTIVDKDKREELFFDYTMQIGDTLRYNPNIDYYGNVSDSYQCIRLAAIRDTVMPNGDGKVRKAYHVQSGQYDEGVYRFDESLDGLYIFIEDIGFVFEGLSHPSIELIGGWSTLLYVKQDDTMLYQEKEGVVWSNSSSEEDKAPYLVKEGKKWHIRTEVPYVNKNTYDIFMWVEGDTIINGVSYKKLHKQTRNVKDSSMGTFEIGYCHQANNRYYQNGELMFDFSLQEGDVFYPRKGEPLTVRRTGKMALDDGIMRKYLLMVADTQDPDTTYNADYWIEGIGSLKTGILTNDFTSDGLIKELQSCTYNGEYIYKSKTNETKPVSRPTNRKGYGIYYDDSFLYRYTINEAEEVTDSTDFARWYDKTVIYFDVDSVGRDAFANACFRQGQILYFTEKLRYIGQDAFGDILMLDDEPEAKNPFGDLCIVFSGENPPSIDENSIVNYADTTYRITYVVPDLATYIEDDMQWTYSQLVTIDDFIAGYISPENEVVVSDSAGVDLEVGVIEDNTLTGAAALYVAASPKKDIPVRIGDGENKDIYSRAPAWMCYTVEVVMTDSKGDTLYTDKQQCNAYDKCYFEVKLTTLPEDGIVCVYSRSIDQYGNASDWTMKKIHLMNIDSVAAPENNSPYYDMQGREVSHPTRGIYIKDGRKVIVHV